MYKNGLENEWTVLQNQFDSYEKLSLAIKLFSVGVIALAYTSQVIGVFLVVLLLVLWLQDAIWKTFQARIETRLLQVEAAIAVGESVDNHVACQFNSHYMLNRPGTVGLVFEYFKQAVRPTIAFPHIILVMMAIAELIV